MSMESQINDLANFIMNSVEGEPSKSEGACVTAMRIIKQLQTELAAQKNETARLSAMAKIFENGEKYLRGKLAEIRLLTWKE